MNKSVFSYYLKNNKKSFFMLMLLFCLGIMGGIAFINHANEIQTEEICSYVNSLKENIKNSDGCTMLGSFLIYIAIIYKGFSIGYTVSAMLATLGIKAR